MIDELLFKKLTEFGTSTENLELDPTTYRLRALLGGFSGSGKTTSAMSAPGRKLLIDTDIRGNAVVGFPNVWIKEIREPNPKAPTAWRELLKLQTKLVEAANATDQFPFDTIIYDGLTSMNRICMNWALLLDPQRGLGQSPARQHYGPQMHNLAQFIQSALSLPCHIILTCHPELHEVEGEGMVFLPKMYGKTRTELPNWFNETYYCHRDPGEEKRTKYTWQTSGSGKEIFYKSTLNQLGRYWTDPITVEPPKDLHSPEPWGFTKLLELRFQGYTIKKEE